jgi:sugar phosphate isomerase/epimerase
MERHAMKIGFLTSLFSSMTFEDLIDWAADAGFGYIEAAAWPPGYDKICQYYAATIDATTLNDDIAEKKRKVLENKKIKISSLAYYDNNLSPDQNKRKKIHEHLKKVINAAQMMKTELVGTFIGRNPSKTIEENIKEAVPIFSDLVTYARDRGVKLMIENCPMIGWQMEGLVGNVFFAPSIWEDFFNSIPDDYFGMNFDPSHLLWQRIDYCKAAVDFSDKIFHFHAKDTKILKKELSRNGIYGSNWWVPVAPTGKGDIDWKKMMDTLKKINYDGVISIELEDAEYEKTFEKVKEGHILSLNYLKSMYNE